MKKDVKLSKISNGMTLAYDKMGEVDSVIVQIAVPVGSQNGQEHTNKYQKQLTMLEE